jgi:hypothetical protein
MSRIAIVVAAVVLGTGCNRPRDDREPAPATEPRAPSEPAGAGRALGSAAPNAPPPAAVDPTLLDHAKLFTHDPPSARKALEVDASGTGAALEVRVVQRLGDALGDARSLELLVVIRGDHTLALAIAGFRDRGLPAVDAQNPRGTMLAIPPGGEAPELSPDVPRLEVAAPVLHWIGFHVAGRDDHLALVHDRDQLVLHHLIVDDEAAASASWKVVARAKLASGAAVTVR